MKSILLRRTFFQMKDSYMNTGSRTRAPLIGCALFLSVGVRSAAIADSGDADSAAKLCREPDCQRDQHSAHERCMGRKAGLFARILADARRKSPKLRKENVRSFSNKRR